jgi:hypothetical protein
VGYVSAFMGVFFVASFCGFVAAGGVCVATNFATQLFRQDRNEERLSAIAPRRRIASGGTNTGMGGGLTVARLCTL